MIRWFKCKNQECKSYNQDFTLIIENPLDKEICPFCHQPKTLERQTELEWENKYRLLLEVK
jgi:hypothetical protein